MRTHDWDQHLNLSIFVASFFNTYKLAKYLWHMNRFLMNYYVLWLKKLLIIIVIQGQPDFHPREPGETYRLPPSENVQHNIYTKQARSVEYRMVDPNLP